MTEIVRVPAELKENFGDDPQKQQWLAAIPEMALELRDQWSLTLGEPYINGTGSWVAQCERVDGTPAVLKIGWPHYEARDEAIGLMFWAGKPTINVFDADLALNAILLEQAEPGSALSSEPLETQNRVLSELFSLLWRQPPKLNSFRPLAEMIEYWANDVISQRSKWQNPDLTEQGLEAFEELLASNDEKYVLATDLHAGNVLRSQRQPWLVIDPKPFLGERAYDLTQHLWNHLGEVSEDLTEIDRLAASSGVDAERVRKWFFARLATTIVPTRHGDLNEMYLLAKRLL